jgi:DNA repair exonuclease SbcCD ATPase subunit
MASLDEGVVNLQRFIGLLANATSATHQVDEHVTESARLFAEMEGEADEEGGGLNDRLTDFAGALPAEEAEAVKAIGELAQAAADAQGVVDDAQEKVDQAAVDLESTASAVDDDIEHAATQLTSEGFTPLGQVVEEAQQELESEVREEEQAFTQLETAVRGFETEAEAAFNEAEGELEKAAGEMADAETALEAASNEGVQGFETAGAEMESACSALQADVDLIYDALDSGVEAQGQAWEQAVQAAAGEAHTFVADATQRLGQVADMVEKEALATLDQEYEAVGAVLDAAGTVVSDLEPLAEELTRGQAVLGDIDALMDALAS